jgi:hypothetical protein
MEPETNMAQAGLGQLGLKRKARSLNGLSCPPLLLSYA